MHEFVQSALLPGLSEGAIFGLIAVAFAVLFTTTGVINFAHGQMVMLMPMAILVGVGAGLPIWIAYLVALLLMVAIGLLQEWAAVRPFMQSGHSVSWILSTLGISVVLAELLAIPYDGESKNFAYGISSERVEIFGFATSLANIATVAALIMVSIALTRFYRKTKVGLEIRAMADDVDGAEAIGISRARASQTAMTLSILVASITGILVASTQLVTPSLGLTYTFYGFVATAMGGMGSIPGALAGGLVVGVVSQTAAVYFDGLFVNLVVFGLLLAVYVVRPHGLFGRAPVREV